ASPPASASISKPAPRRPGPCVPGCPATRQGWALPRKPPAVQHRWPLPPAPGTGAWIRLLSLPTSRSGRNVSRSPNGCSPTRCGSPRSAPNRFCCSTPHYPAPTCSAGSADWMRRYMADRACDVGELLPVGLPLARAAKGLALLETGQLAAAATCQDPDVGPEWYLAAGYQLRLRATLAYRQGRIDDACSAFDLLEQRTGEWGIADPSHIPSAADAIAAYLAAGRRGDARQVADRLAHPPLPTRGPAATAAARPAAPAPPPGHPQARHA